ncbi:GNAT family N-acetyltransferase [candidate division KSB1 bacterium]|nr:GNAT family N-acetyltransferase [candidate division KSB1 bacterium]
MLFEYEFIDRISEEQIFQLMQLYRNEWWTKDRKLEDVRRMLAHTDFIFAFYEKASRQLVAFTRVLSDRVYKALIFDVIVAPEHREHKLGRALMNAVLNHPELKSVRHFELYCLPELEPFYEQWGFTKEVGGVRFMRKA